MSYYTKFEISFSGKKERIEQAFQYMKEHIASIFASMDANEILNGESIYFSEKWDSWRVDMKDVSENFPDVKIEIEGEGEDEDDWWFAVVYGGEIKVAYAEITSPRDVWEQVYI